MMRHQACLAESYQTFLDVDAEAADRRWAGRKKTVSAGAILSPELPIPIPCVLRDVSTTGARLELIASSENSLGARARLPSYFTLAVRVDRVEVECAIAWRRSGQIGVRFVSTPRAIGRTIREAMR